MATLGEGLERLLNNNPLRNAQVEAMVRRLWIEAGRPMYGSVLVLGAHSKSTLKEARRRFKPRSLVCVEGDVDLAKECRKADGGTRILETGFNRLPFEDGEFQAVIGLSALQRTPDWRDALGEIARVLKPGGVFVFETMGEDMWWTLDMPEWLNTVLGWEPREDDPRHLDRGSFLEELPGHGLHLIYERNLLIEGWIEGLAVREN